MRLFGILIVMSVLGGSAGVASAQNYCPFLDFCGAQRHHCQRNCGALTDVLDWSQRPGWLQYCGYRCEVQESRCAARAFRHCIRP